MSLSTAQIRHSLKVARWRSLDTRALEGGHVGASHILERTGLALAEACKGPYALADIIQWVKDHTHPGVVITGDSAEVLHGKQTWSDYICWVANPEDDDIWLPWLGCHVVRPIKRCRHCGRPDEDDGHLPCPCGY
jgi:hypothetical protein